MQTDSERLIDLLTEAHRHATTFYERAIGILKVPLIPELPAPVAPAVVPLEQADVPPGSVFRPSHWKGGWMNPQSVCEGFVNWDQTMNGCTSYEELMRRGWLIKRPGEPWQPASKPQPAAQQPA